MINCKECEREFETLDSLRRHRVQKHKISAEQTYIDYTFSGVQPVCKCGCGEKVNFLSIEKGFVDYILGHASRVSNNWGHNKSALDKSHSTQKKMHDEGTLKVWNDGLTINDPRVRANIDAVMANPNRGDNISKALSDVPKSEEHKLKIKENAIIRWANPDEREKQSHKGMQYIIKNGFTVKSKLEDKFIDLLEKYLGLTEHEHYHRQHYVRDIKGLFDFKISGKKILIEVDGDFWHCNPNTKFSEPVYEAQKGNLRQDKIKEQWCVNNGYKLLRFWELDINNKPEEVINELKKELGFN
jgi:very-short-patch-repair endonuclease